MDGHFVYLPVSVLYEHLETFAKKIAQGNNNIDYLIWGDNPNIEKDLLNKISHANDAMTNDECDYSTVTSNVLLIISSDTDQLYIPNTNKNIIIKEFYPDSTANEPVSDNLLHDYVCDWLKEKEYDCLILPLCFGPVLSDYNGLRLAMHIRCTTTLNQNKPIFIYGVADLAQLTDNEYFDILKTKSIKLINYDNNSLLSSMSAVVSPLESDEIKNGISKIHLNLPQNYIDSHSIANEWAIYRWAKTIGVKDSDIEKVTRTVESNLYFKYLNIIYPVYPQNQLKEKDLIISTSSSNNPRILLVDDEAEKGWYEIFCTIINDINGFYFDHLDYEFNEKSPDEIVKIVHDRILDYRLHRKDFYSNKVSDITGFKVLNDIKNNINQGIQVIVMSATNKIWNWEALKEAGADAFIMKDNPDANIDFSSTTNSITKLLESIGCCCDRLFLKQFYNDYNSLIKNFVPRRSIKASNPLPKEFVDETIKWYELSCRILSESVCEHSIASSYLFLFSVLENITNQIINIDNPIEYQDPSSGKLLYRYKFRMKDQYLRQFVDKTAYKTKRYVEVEDPKVKPTWTQKIYNTLDFLASVDNSIDYRHLVDVRNDFIHANSIENSIEKKKIYISKNDLIDLHNIVTYGLNSI